MYPILFESGAFVLPAWHTFYVIGAIASLLVLLGLGRRFAPEVEQRDLSRLFAICYVLSYFGARLLSIVVEEPTVRTPGEIAAAISQFGPMTFYGGAIVAFVAGTAYVVKRKLPFGTLVDLSIPAGLVGLGLGRIGCFLNGDDYGKAVPLTEGGEPPWWSVTFPVLDDGLARYPVQLMEAGAAFALAAGLIVLFPKLVRAFKPGIVGFLGIVGYANLRFGLEFLRDDFRGSPFGNWMSTSQFISMLILVACALTLPYWVMSRRSRPSIATNG